MPFEFDHETKNAVVFSGKHLTFSYCFLWEWFDLKFVFVGIIGHVFVIDKAFKNQVLKRNITYIDSQICICNISGQA